MAIKGQVLDALEAFNILIVFSSVLFGLKYGDIIVCLHEEVPTGPKALSRLESKTLRVLLTACVPPATIALSTFLLYLPLMLEIRRACELALWDYDPIVTGFVLVEVLMMLFACWCLVLTLQTYRRLRLIRHKQNLG